ncbi:MAG: hypothetical protein ACLRSE_07295 [Alistipes finegoldii]
MEFFGKFVLCSNNERNPVLIEAAETRYWVRRVPPLLHDDQHLLAKMRAEIPGLLFYLQQRMFSSHEESRMWFAPRLLVTDALRRIVHYNRKQDRNRNAVDHPRHYGGRKPCGVPVRRERYGQYAGDTRHPR